MVSDSLQGKVVVVTGGDSPSTVPVAAELARRGAVLSVQYDTSFADARDLVRGIEKDGGQAIAVRAALTDESRMEALCRRTMGALGALDALLVDTSAAAPGHGEAAPAEAFDALRHRLEGWLAPAHAALRTLASQQRSGAVVYLTAGAGPDAALARSFVPQLAAGARRCAVRINAVAAAPGPADAVRGVVDLVAALTAGELSRLSGAVLALDTAPLD
ncbi:SDR family NAD(P)-dependent oxidoreductase [Streptomyces sp. NPDC050560]|uniref:SDR family NAD(P)-dependent oxidoreductase n=1 Tax=Streptomyces sp. NPDC050560 TaxID=3365630 RepID=UPI00379E5F7E